MAIQRHDHDGELRGLLYSETAPDNKGKRFDSPDFGYGALGAGGATVPNATLVFDVELLEVRSRPAWRI